MSPVRQASAIAARWLLRNLVVVNRPSAGGPEEQNIHGTSHKEGRAPSAVDGSLFLKYLACHTLILQYSLRLPAIFSNARVVPKTTPKCLSACPLVSLTWGDEEDILMCMEAKYAMCINRILFCIPSCREPTCLGTTVNESSEVHRHAGLARRQQTAFKALNVFVSYGFAKFS